MTILIKGSLKWSSSHHIKYHTHHITPFHIYSLFLGLITPMCSFLPFPFGSKWEPSQQIILVGEKITHAYVGWCSRTRGGEEEGHLPYSIVSYRQSKHTTIDTMEEMVQQQQHHIPPSTSAANSIHGLPSSLPCCRLCSHKEADVVVTPCGCHIHAVRLSPCNVADAYLT